MKKSNRGIGRDFLMRLDKYDSDRVDIYKAVKSTAKTEQLFNCDDYSDDKESIEDKQESKCKSNVKDNVIISIITILFLVALVIIGKYVMKMM